MHNNINFAVQHVTPCLYVTVCFTNSGAHLPAARRHLPAHHKLYPKGDDGLGL